MNVRDQLLLIWGSMVLVMLLGWWHQQKTRNAGIVDTLWAFGVGGAAVLTALTTAGPASQRLLVAVLGSAWGLRLGLYLHRRNAGRPEDGRYAALREHWQGSAWRFLLFFQFQAALVPLFALPFIAAARDTSTSPALQLVGTVVWLLSVWGELDSDRRLERFRLDPRNRGAVCRDGWWALSRHPNYFFEWLHWFAYVTLCLGSEWCWMALSGPIVMGLFLRFVSGIPYTEAQALRSRGQAYRDYQAQTPMFFPRIALTKLLKKRSTP
jgi:steroid 5-alpha reductase family enzyme